MLGVPLTLGQSNTGEAAIEYQTVEPWSPFGGDHRTANGMDDHIVSGVSTGMPKRATADLPFTNTPKSGQKTVRATVRYFTSEKAKSAQTQKTKNDLQKQAKAMGMEGYSAPVTDDRGNVSLTKSLTRETNKNG
ncbi:hypothetical protein AB6F55_20230 [Providencia hangzhouensis]